MSEFSDAQGACDWERLDEYLEAVTLEIVVRNEGMMGVEILVSG
jgi:hypothetical protein